MQIDLPINLGTIARLLVGISLKNLTFSHHRPKTGRSPLSRLVKTSLASNTGFDRVLAFFSQTF